jgi:hypothetical protein
LNEPYGEELGRSSPSRYLCNLPPIACWASPQGVFKGVISSSIALQTRVICSKGWLMKTPGVSS